MKLNFNACDFLLSASQPRHFVSDQGREIAFVGRSNAGKSSTINCLTRQKRLARISKTPGRTQLINFFQFKHLEPLRLVDLPGYGFAKVDKRVKAQWHQLIDYYLRHRISLCGIILIMDARHPLQPFDLQILDWSLQSQYKLHILLNKADKLSRNQALASLNTVKKYLDKEYNTPVQVQLFSANKGTGLEVLEAGLTHWLLEPT